ncbi:MAG TPA: glycosyltransferase family 4 protein [Alphaproteobacteria bacterium]|nr:glycosyltransferase family 4 protein [Alphaproteobacteria bacterium]
MNAPLPALVWLITALPIAAVLTRLVLSIARRRNFVDKPNQRSSHVEPRALGGGWAVVLTVLPLWAVVSWIADQPPPWAILAAAVLLVAVSWADDLRNLPPLPRLLAHVAAAGIGVAALPGDQLVFQGILPFWADRLVAGIAWVWFVNLYNFMDGIDGITGVETTTIALGLTIVMITVGAGGTLAIEAVVLGGAMLGFLIWNWQPARIFLGDVGSVPIGFLTGWLLLAAAANGLWAPALILPGYYLADATVTLLRRAARGDRIWQAHREHFYQQAVRAGLSHGSVALRILATNLLLVVLAVATSFTGPAGKWFLVVAAAVAITVLLCLLAARRAVAS